MLSKPVLLVDQDNVLADWKTYFLTQLERNHQIAPVDILQFKMLDNFPAEHKDQIQDTLDLPNFYLELEVIPGAVDALKYLSNHFDVFICTSPYTTNIASVSHKFEWVKNHLGPEWVSKMVVTKDKTLVQGVVLIDDKPEVLGVLKPSWQHVVFDATYNQPTNTGHRIHGWGHGSCDYLVTTFANG